MLIAVIMLAIFIVLRKEEEVKGAYYRITFVVLSAVALSLAFCQLHMPLFSASVFAGGIGLALAGRNQNRRLVSFACALVTTMIVYAAMGWHRKVQVDLAKAYVKEVMPFVESYKETHGRYPIVLENCLSEEERRQVEAPCLVKHKKFYRANGDSYRFMFYDP